MSAPRHCWPLRGQPRLRSRHSRIPQPSHRSARLQAGVNQARLRDRVVTTSAITQNSRNAKLTIILFHKCPPPWWWTPLPTTHSISEGAGKFALTNHETSLMRAQPSWSPELSRSNCPSSKHSTSQNPRNTRHVVAMSEISTNKINHLAFFFCSTWDARSLLCKPLPDRLLVGRDPFCRNVGLTRIVFRGREHPSVHIIGRELHA